MEPSKVYDFCILGGGYGGLIASLNALRNNLTVAMVEKRAQVGGTCLWEGCIPSKCLLNSSYKFYEATHIMAKHGVHCKEVTHDYEAMMKKKADLLSMMGTNNTNKLKNLGCDIFHGVGKLVSKEEVEVTDGENKQIIKAKNIILNMGGDPAPLPGNSIPIDGKRVIVSTQALSLPSLPKKMIVVGGGFIGVELGCHYSRLGTDVTIIEFFDRILNVFDKEVSFKLEEILKGQGVKFLTSCKVTSGKAFEDKVEITVEDAQGGNPRQMETDILFVATGRRPATRGVGLEEVGVVVDKFGRVVVNEKLQSNIPNIYAIGDVSNMGPPLAHKAEDEALALIDQFLGKKTHLNYDNVPSVVYTHPEVAAVGKTEEQLIQAGVEYKKGICPLTANSRAKCNDETEGFIKFLVCKKTNKILGIHMIGPQVGEQVMEGVLCIEYGTTSDLIGRTSHGHPTFAEAFKDAAMTASKAN
jgi:dihydrolipoamide dehydrogenase